MTIILHHLDKSRSQRVLWLLEELGVDYEIKFYKRTPQYLAPDSLKKVHPLGKSPVIQDGDRIIAETGLIVEYLVAKYGPQLAPPKDDEDLQLRYKYFLHFGEGTFMPFLVINLLLNFAATKSFILLRPFAKIISYGLHRFYITKNIQNIQKFLNGELAKNPQNWFVKDFSGADILLSYPIEASEDRFGIEEYPSLKKYLEAIHARPAYKRALEKGKF